jgi:hypothetical protein
MLDSRWDISRDLKSEIINDIQAVQLSVTNTGYKSYNCQNNLQDFSYHFPVCNVNIKADLQNLTSVKGDDAALLD